MKNTKLVFALAGLVGLVALGVLVNQLVTSRTEISTSVAGADPLFPPLTFTDSVILEEAFYDLIRDLGIVTENIEEVEELLEDAYHHGGDIKKKLKEIEDLMGDLGYEDYKTTPLRRVSSSEELETKLRMLRKMEKEMYERMTEYMGKIDEIATNKTVQKTSKLARCGQYLKDAASALKGKFGQCVSTVSRFTPCWVKSGASKVVWIGGKAVAVVNAAGAVMLLDPFLVSYDERLRRDIAIASEMCAGGKQIIGWPPKGLWPTVKIQTDMGFANKMLSPEEAGKTLDYIFSKSCDEKTQNWLRQQFLDNPDPFYISYLDNFYPGFRDKYDLKRPVFPAIDGDSRVPTESYKSFEEYFEKYWGTQTSPVLPRGGYMP